MVTMLLITFFIIVMFWGFVKANRELNLKELFIDDKTGHLSHTKYWSNIAYLTSTVAFISLNIFHVGDMQGSQLEMLWLIYTGVVASNAAVSKLISHKYQSGGSSTTSYRDSPVVDDDYVGPGRRSRPRTMDVGRQAKQAAIDDPDA